MKNPYNNIKSWDELNDLDVIRVIWYRNGERGGWYYIIENGTFYKLDLEVMPGGEDIVKFCDSLGARTIENTWWKIEMIQKLDKNDERVVRLRKKFIEWKQKSIKKEQLDMFSKGMNK